MRQVLTDNGPATGLAGPPSVVLVPATIPSIGIARAALRLALDEHDWETDPVFRVLLGTTEAIANAVQHGSEPDGLVEVTYQVTDVQCYVRIMDSGSGDTWHPPAAPLPPSVKSERGRGLVLMANLAQSVEVRSAGAGTEVRMSFTRHI
jgi:anti-sigma regulatory factor (Ser/Thr protein kinase)